MVKTEIETKAQEVARPACLPEDLQDEIYPFEDLQGMAGAPPKKVTLYASRPQAGFPSPGDDQVERVLDINDLVVHNPASTFFVRVEGDSMEGAGIFSGDVLVVDRAIDAKEGRIVLAAVNGEMLVKRLGRLDGRQVLLSENDQYAPIFLGEDEECYLWGVVVGSVRQF